MKRFGPLCAALGVLICAGRAQSQMTPLEDRREIHARATFVGVTQYLEDFPPAPFAFFNSFVGPFVPNPDPEGPGSCEAASFQVSEFFPAGINASGTTSGSWNTLDDGTYNGFSLARFKFRIDTCIEYHLDAWVDPGDFVGSGEFLLEAMPSGLKHHDINSGELHLIGRLSPGDYAIEGRSSFTTSLENFQGGTYSYIFTCSSCPNPFIGTQPVGLLVPCGTNAVFSVGTLVPPAGLTFQWRRNGVPLPANTHTTGVTTPTLTVHNACYPDTGHYDVLVSDGTIIEPSRVVRLDITTQIAVEPIAATSTLDFELAGPSPFTRETSFRYAASVAQHTTIAVYDISGARIRTLVDRVSAGAGVVTWDGRTSAGTRARAGVYFVRMESGALFKSSRVVLLN